MRGRISSERFWYEINDTFGSSGGIYVLSCTDDDDKGATIPINRLLAVDSDGVLYIGMAKSFLDRVIELKKSLSPEHVSRSHECGSRHKNHVLISELFPYERLQVDLIEAEDPMAAELEALNKYMAKFGELPPLNRVN
ncbi:MAG: hypothetical protein PHF20_06935 [Halothiobacillaceae bacterium]|nr:hypothetical protein [Halothiobacillaceae bacterium]